MPLVLTKHSASWSYSSNDWEPFSWNCRHRPWMSVFLFRPPPSPAADFDMSIHTVNSSSPPRFAPGLPPSPLVRLDAHRWLASTRVVSIAFITFMLLVGWCILPRCVPGLGSSLAFAAEPEPIRVAPNDWPWWRGPHGNGIAASDQKAPTTWSATNNIVWKANVPGRGHSSPTVICYQVIVSTPEE